ncbi:nucleotide sugar dehydrogenase [Leptolyngbya sp. 7M]|uniref:nucleotide sugar dehydrogenase n=1 Tax=Leptolyngbya sp. 7M TaxID=2812896 RepID=UPI001B8D7323|nr:nucleotide sugar dehydrogenase [Leptolyngbya sp. 7M]QYO62161.1 nucleotide sugar dehydrogenase [Leptolyngbya sp. 7M]
MIDKISVIGLGKLGASMAAAFASRGFDVIGVDVNQRSIELVNEGRAPVQETGLDELISANRHRIRATASHEEAVLGSDISFVIVPTPSDERGAFSLQYAAWAFKEIGKALGKKNSYHNVVLTSTVLPGGVREALLPILEKESGKKAGKDFGLCYSPEFIALGSIIRNFLNPDFTLIGEFDDRCGSQLEELYSRVVENGAPSARMSLENAELTKISVNAFVTTKITFANFLAEMCEKIPGGNIDIVSNALGMDSRIGRKYLTGGLGYGGPCFPRDNFALGFLARELGVDEHLSSTTDSLNRSVAKKVVERLRPMIRENITVGVLGLSYKPFSHVLEESQALFIAQAISRAGARVVAYDPMASEMPQEELRGDFVVVDSVEECIRQSEIILIATPDPAFAELKANNFKNGFSKVTVVDFWRILKNELEKSENIRYVGFGLGQDDGSNSKRLRELWTGGGPEELVTGAK